MYVALLSGGKDSTLATFWALQQGWDVMALTFVPSKKHSYMLQDVNVRVAHLVARALDIPHAYVEVSGEKEREVEEMLNAVKRLKPEGLISGAIASEYQKQRIDRIGDRLNIPTYAPLWHKSPDVLFEYREMTIIYTRIAAEGLPLSLLGKPFQPLSDPYHPLLEGGEGETLVVDAPFFKYRIRAEGKVRPLGPSEGEYIIQRAWLEEKSQL